MSINPFLSGLSKLLSATFCFLLSILVLWLRTSHKIRCCGKGSIIICFHSLLCAMVISFHIGMVSMKKFKANVKIQCLDVMICLV
jgi:hypothetical protein